MGAADLAAGGSYGNQTRDQAQQQLADGRAVGGIVDQDGVGVQALALQRGEVGKKELDNPGPAADERWR